MIYQNGSLKEILTPEGYIENGVYYYYLQDHQGNNRVVINSSGAVQEYSHYYPDGMRYIPESSTNAAAIPYRYNNKEFEAMNGLNQYDYGARRKYSWGGPWPTQDMLSENYYSSSPYTYCLNNPVNAVDLNGMLVTSNQDSTAYTVSGYDVYTYFGILQEVRKGYSKMSSLESALYNASKKNKGKGGKMDQTLDELTVTASAPKKKEEESSWLYPIIGKLDGNKYLDNRRNEFIYTPQELQKGANYTLAVGLSILTPADIVGVAATSLVKLGYSAAEQALMRSILFAMQHPGAAARIGGTAAGLVQYAIANKLGISLPPDAIQSSVGKIFDLWQMGSQTVMGGRDIVNEMTKK
jgi:RHS repeat-associated protein